MIPKMSGTALVDGPTDRIDGVRVGRLVGRTDAGEPLVEFAGSAAPAVVARVATEAPRPAAGASDRDVLLVFENGDPSLPIIIGVVERTQRETTALATGMLQRDSRDPIRVDGRTLELSAKDQIVLTCGRSSIALYADGRVVVKGTRLISRASESNKIKGATVAIN